MVRECVALSIVALTTPACSLLLDFDAAPPPDAGTDAPYTQANCSYKEPNDSVATAMMLDPATETGPAAICAAMGGTEDRDFYKFNTASATVAIAISFMNRPGGDLDIKLYDVAGTMLAQSRGFGNGEMLTCPGASPSCPTLAPGAYLLEVFPAVPGSVNAYTIAITP